MRKKGETSDVQGCGVSPFLLFSSFLSSLLFSPSVTVTMLFTAFPTTKQTCCDTEFFICCVVVSIALLLYVRTNISAQRFGRHSWGLQCCKASTVFDLTQFINTQVYVARRQGVPERRKPSPFAHESITIIVPCWCAAVCHQPRMNF